MALKPAPARTEISDTYPNPSNAIARTGFGKLWDFATSLLGDDGSLLDMLSTSKLTDPHALYNFSLVPSVNANALTMTLKSSNATSLAVDNAAIVSQRHATLATGQYNVRQITADISTVISSGSTAGHTSALTEYLFWYIIDNAGTQELAWSTKDYGASGIASTTAEGGAGAADSATVMYSTTARTNVPFRCIARMISIQTTAGLWAAIPTVIELAPFAARTQNMPAGIGPLPYSGSVIPEGWLETNGALVSRATYAALFKAIGVTWGVGDGSTTFQLPDSRGKGWIGDGTGTHVVSGTNADVDTATDGFTVPSNSARWITGMPVVFTLASGTITGLTSGTTYYIVRSSATLIKLASSLANAQNGTVIDFTAKSSPVWSLTYTIAARTLGEYLGEESHAMSITELLSHTHSGILLNGGGGGQFEAGASSVTSMGSAGGNAAMNNMQPSFVGKGIISF